MNPSPYSIRQPGLRGLCLLVLLVLPAVGCHRTLWRQAADRDAYCLVRQKANDPRWPLENFSVYPDPASRMFDPFDPDYSPLPPDDPTAHRLMHCVYCMEGSPCWHCQGDRQEVENPSWCMTLPTESGKVPLDPNSAIELALLHSPEYQRELEDLYLSALDVSFERFRFDTQFFGGYTGFLTLDGRERGGGGGESQSILDLRTLNWAVRKRFATGGELVVRLANSLMWQFSGPDTHSANTLLDFALVQPLMRRAWREIALEDLTQSERNLLANVRQMERFRRGFYLEIFLGRGATAGPVRALLGIPTTGIASADAGGFLGLLQTQQTIRNQRGNLAALESSVAQLESFYLGDRIDYFQVELARQAFYSAQSSLLNAELRYFNELDQFKIQLGLPPSLNVEIDDELIRPFQLVDPEAVDLRNRVTLLQRSVGKTIVDLLDAFRPPAESETEQQDDADSAVADRPAPRSPAEEEELTRRERDRRVGTEYGQPDAEKVRALLQQLQKQLQRAFDVIAQTAGEDSEQVAQDIVRLKEKIPVRVESMERLRRELTSGKHEWHVDRISSDISPEDAEEIIPFEENRLRALPEQLTKTLGDVELVFGRLEKVFREIDDVIEAAREEDVDEALFETLRDRVFTRLPDELNNLAANVLSLSLVQARARTESVTLEQVDVSWERAYSTAREYRRDWMNARASLVDSWRQIIVTADELESRFDLVVEGDISNSGDNPLRLRGNTGRLRFGFEFEAPLSRLAERNVYREALIEYQRARRQFYRFRDAIAANLRSTIRTLDINQLNFEFRRAAIGVAIAQVELARFRLSEPPRPGQPSQLSNTTARDLVSALTDLLDAQNNFLAVWISHETLRRSLDFDMGIMELNENGAWIDPGKVTDESLPVSSQGTTWEHCEQPVTASGPKRSSDTDSVDAEYDAGIFAEGVDRLPDPATDAEDLPSDADVLQILDRSPVERIPALHE